jgi:hypothetical protein
MRCRKLKVVKNARGEMVLLRCKRGAKGVGKVELGRRSVIFFCGDVRADTGLAHRKKSRWTQADVRKTPVFTVRIFFAKNTEPEKKIVGCEPTLPQPNSPFLLKKAHCSGSFGAVS